MYKPTVNDYVKWKNIEGWVYFVGEEYCTIEIGVKCKDRDDLKECPIHEKIHCLVVCYTQEWDKLLYIGRRATQHDNELILDK